jgi:hypothetical protein
MSPPISRFTNLEFLDNSGGRRAGSQPRELFEFGEATTRRSLISPRDLQTIVKSYQSIDEMKQVFVHQLSVEGDVIDLIRADDTETFTLL